MIYPISDMLERSERACARASSELLPASIRDAVAIQHALITALVQAAHLENAVFDSVTGSLIPR